MNIDRKDGGWYCVWRLHVGRTVLGLFSRPWPAGCRWNDPERYVDFRIYLDGSWHIRILWLGIGRKAD